MPLPAPTYTFASLPGPRVWKREGAREMILPLARGEGMLPGAPRGRRELLVTDPGSGRPDHVALLPGNSSLPLVLAAAIGAFVLLMLAGLYALAPVALLPVAVLIWLWVRGLAEICDARHDHPAVPVAPGLSLPIHLHARTTLGQSGLACLLVANATFFASLMFGVGFLSVVAPNWPAPAPTGDGGLAVMLVAGLIASLLTAAALGRYGGTAQGSGRGIMVPAMLALGCNLLALGCVVALAVTVMDDPTRHARDALRGVLAGYVALHALICASAAAFVVDQARRGEIGDRRAGAVPGWRMWQDFTAVTTLVAGAVVIMQGLSA